MITIRKSAGLFVLFTFLGIQCGSAADFNVVNNGSTHYTINGANDPTLTLVRGQTYTFSINAINHPFYSKTNAVTGTAAAYNTGVTGNGTQNGLLTFVVPLNAPNSLVYICSAHSAMQGVLLITNPPAVPALLSNPRTPAPGQFGFDVVGTGGRMHVIEVSTNLTSGWFPIATNSTVSGSFSFTDSGPGAFARRLYRVSTR